MWFDVKSCLNRNKIDAILIFKQLYLLVYLSNRVNVVHFFAQNFMLFQMAWFIFVDFDLEKITYFQLYFLKDFAYDVSFLAIKIFARP